MRDKPAIVGGFILGALALGVASILFFGGIQLFTPKSRVVAYFSESVAGLDAGAPVTFRGVRIGSVQRIEIQFSTNTITARFPVFLELQPQGLVWEGKELTGSAGDFQRLVEAGLRAQLVMQSIVTGQLRVDLDFHPGTPAKLVGSITDVPEIPAVPSELGKIRSELSDLPLRELAEAAEKTITSIGHLSDHVDSKLDPLIDSAQHTLNAAHGTLQAAENAVRHLQSDASGVLRNLDALLVEARGQVGARGGELSRTLTDADHTFREAQTLLQTVNGLAEPRSSFRGDLESTMRDLAAAASALRAFADTVDRNPNALLMGRSSR